MRFELVSSSQFRFDFVCPDSSKKARIPNTFIFAGRKEKPCIRQLGIDLFSILDKHVLS